MELGAPKSIFDKQYVLPSLDVKLCKTGQVPWLLTVLVIPLKERVGAFQGESDEKTFFSLQTHSFLFFPRKKAMYHAIHKDPSSKKGKISGFLPN